MPMIKILFFGRLSDAAQPMNCELPEGVSTAVNQMMTPRSATIKDGDEIAFMSPLSGG